jgi:hypothetical protein
MFETKIAVIGTKETFVSCAPILAFWMLPVFGFGIEVHFYWSNAS